MPINPQVSLCKENISSNYEKISVKRKKRPNKKKESETLPTKHSFEIDKDENHNIGKAYHSNK